MTAESDASTEGENKACWDRSDAGLLETSTEDEVRAGLRLFAASSTCSARCTMSDSCWRTAAESVSDCSPLSADANRIRSDVSNWDKRCRGSDRLAGGDRTDRGGEDTSTKYSGGTEVETEKEGELAVRCGEVDTAADCAVTEGGRDEGDGRSEEASELTVAASLSSIGEKRGG